MALEEVKKNLRTRILEEVSDFITSMDQKFVETYYPHDIGFSLYDLNAKYGLVNIMDNWEQYKSQEFSQGDIIAHQHLGFKAVVTKVLVDRSLCCVDRHGEVFKLQPEQAQFFKKLGHIDNVEQILEGIFIAK